MQNVHCLIFAEMTSANFHGDSSLVAVYTDQHLSLSSSENIMEANMFLHCDKCAQCLEFSLLH